MKEQIDPTIADKILIQTVGSTISKVALFICCAVVAGMMIDSCQVDEEVIVQCKESCGITAGMKEGTATTCSCNPVPDISQNQWVIPKK